MRIWMCIILADQHHSRRTIQSCKWLHIRKTELVLLWMEWLPWLLSGFTTHCVIHREMLASQKLSPELDSVLNDAIKVTNHIKAHALNWRLFEQLCEEMDAEHKGLRVFESLASEEKSLLKHICTFQWHGMARKTCLLVWHIQPAQWTQSSLQGRVTTVFKLADKVAAFKERWEWEWTFTIWLCSMLSSCEQTQISTPWD